MGYFDSIKNNQSLTIKEKKDAFDKQLKENKQKIYPHGPFSYGANSFIVE